MANFNPRAASQEKPWRARRKRDGQYYHLGNFRTKEEAEAAEKAFDEEWPPNKYWARGTKWHRVQVA